MTDLEQARKDRKELEESIKKSIFDFNEKYPDLKIDNVTILPNFHQSQTGKSVLVSVEVNVNVLV